MIKKTLSTYKRCTIAALCATGMMFSVASQAILIDDFNVSNPSIVIDETPGDGAVTGGSAINGANTVMDGASGWTRTLAANLTAGDGWLTEVCNDCQGAHASAGTGGNSTGISTITYGGGVVDMSGEQALSFDWGADLANASVNIVFSDTSGASSTVASWSNLGATGGSAPGNLVAQAAMDINFGGLDSTAINEVRFVVLGVPNLNSIIDNIETSPVPLPAAAYFFGSGLLGLIGISRRRRSAAV